MSSEREANEIAHVYVVIGYDRPNGDQEIIGVYDDQDDANDAIEDPDDWSHAFISKEEVQ